MGTHWPDGGYSADVAIELRQNGRTIPLAACGADHVALCDPTTPVDYGPAVLVVTIDGHENQWPVRFPVASAGIRDMPYEACGPIEAAGCLFRVSGRGLTPWPYG